MGSYMRRQWLVRGIALCSLFGLGILFALHVFIAPEDDADLGVFKRGYAFSPFKRRDGHRFMLVTDDKRTVISAPWSETVATLHLCKKLRYDSHGPLPNASVIITFHNTETISSLLRTIYSIIQRTPTELLHEIIVIDDHSTNDDLGQVLGIYLETVFPPKVKLYRNSVNEGLIRSRLRGSRLSQGEVLVFMDSHSEVQPGWLEPLLFEIKRNRRTLSHSYIDWMEKANDIWHYKRGGSNWIVYFDWRLGFGWQPLPKQQKQKYQTDPIITKVIIGAYAAIDRNFFEEIGELDEGMDFWGGENIDLSLRVWLFGGQVLAVPCSRVAHLEGNDTRSYRNSYSAVIERNYKRVVEVWFDEYKRYFYLYYPSLASVDAGNLTERLKLKSKAKFNFHWLLQNVYPELGIPDRDGFAWGTLKNSMRDLCLEFYSHPQLSQCDDQYTRIFYWSNKFELRQPISIFNLASRRDKNNKEQKFPQIEQYIPFFDNDLGDKWLHWKNGPLIETKTQLCLQAASNSNVIEMVSCNYANNPHQLWEFQFYTEQYGDMLVNNSSMSAYPEERRTLRKLKYSLEKNPNRTNVIVKHASKSGDSSHSRNSSRRFIDTVFGSKHAS